tara:strand:+ start:327 stop:560 length:234 start_codon:yes stop_codon:yes gene_type:complete
MSNTIHDAVMKVLKTEGCALTVDEILVRINQQELYKFNTKSPRGVVSQAIRRRCAGERMVGNQPLFQNVGGRKFNIA